MTQNINKLLCSLFDGLRYCREYLRCFCLKCGEACASVWAFNSATFTDAELASCVKSRVLRQGEVLDQSTSLPPHLQRKEDSYFDVAGRSEPEIILELSDRFVLRKPSGWDIQRSGQESNQKNLKEVPTVPTLQNFLASMHGPPIFGDKGHQFGMIHRLDVPNSGLLLVAKSYRAYYDLMFQMNTGMVRRDYIVLCHGWIPRSCHKILAPLFWCQNGAPSSVRRHGKPARTFLKVLSHLVHQPGLLQPCGSFNRYRQKTPNTKPPGLHRSSACR